MKTLMEVIQDADQLSAEEQSGLATHLLSQMKGAPLGADDEEVYRREAEIEAGTAKPITHDELRKAVGRGAGHYSIISLFKSKFARSSPRDLSKIG